MTVNAKGKNSFVKIPSTLYRIVMSALLFYKKLGGDLQKIVFKVNPHNPCIANKEIKGK